LPAGGDFAEEFQGVGERLKVESLFLPKIR